MQDLATNLSTSESDELLLWYSSTILHLMNQKNNLEQTLKTKSIKLAFPTLIQLQNQLEIQFEMIKKCILKVRQIWGSNSEDTQKPNTYEFKHLHDVQVLKEGGIKELLICNKPVYPIPSYVNLFHLTFVKLETINSSILNVLADCPELQNIAIGGGNKPSNIDDIMLSNIVKKLPKLKIMSLWDTTITDNGLELCKRLQNLESLVVESESLTYEAKKHAQETFKGINTIISIKKG